MTTGEIAKVWLITIKGGWILGVDKTRNMEHSGTFRNIPEHEKIKINFREKKKTIIK